MYDTPLCDLANKHGTNKALLGYTPVYHSLLKKRTAKRILEIGIGAPGLSGGLSEHAASLYMWRDYLPDAEIYAVDVLPELLVNEGNIHSFWADVYRPETLLGAGLAAGGNFDFIVDDAVHDPDTQMQVFETLLPLLADGGTYCIEDVCPDKLGGDLGPMLDRIPHGYAYEIHGSGVQTLLVIRNLSLRTSSRVWDSVNPYTATSPERVSALCAAVRYVVNAGIPGAIVECGVWKGGSMMAVTLTLNQLRRREDLFLFDTFQGMTPPTAEDVDIDGNSAASMLAGGSDQVLAYASLKEVQDNLASTGYPEDRLHYVVGPVEQTIPREAPEQIALLRLDTDFYKSTRHEIEHLIPRMAPGGVVIIDDYGHWRGARKAVDEWLGTRSDLVLYTIDYTGRLIALPSHLSRSSVSR